MIQSPRKIPKKQVTVYIDSETSMQICNKYLASQPLKRVSHIRPITKLTLMVRLETAPTGWDLVNLV